MGDNGLYQPVTHHVTGLKEGEADAADVLKCFQSVLESGAFIFTQIGLLGIPRDNAPGTETHAGQEHKHLIDGGVLRFVKNDEGVI